MVQLVGQDVGPIGYGLMGLTWRAVLPSDEQAFAAMNEALASGANFWNAGELYGTPSYNSLHLLNKYFTKYPENASKVVLSVKGGMRPGTLIPDCSEENLKRSIDETLRVLDGKVKVAIFESARLDGKVPIEQVVGTIAEYVKAGKIGGVGLSEVKAETIRRAAKVTKIAAVEIEFSLFSTDILTNGTAATAKELGIPIVAYSPLGRGFLTGEIKSLKDVPELLREYPRFQPGAFEENLKLVQAVNELAKKKNASAGQIAIAWVHAMSGRKGNPVIIPIPGATTAARVHENARPIDLSEEELAQIDDILKRLPVVGGRYGGAGAKMIEL